MARRITKRTVMDPNELVKMLEAFDTEVDALRALANALNDDVQGLLSRHLTKCLGRANFEVDTNFDIQNGDAFDIMVDGEILQIATDQNFDTGTAIVIATAAYHAAAILSIDADSGTHVDWGAEAETEAGAITNLAAVTASGDVVCGYVTVHAKAGQDWVAGTDALEGGAGGEVSQDTNYFNIVEVGDAALSATVSGTDVTEQVDSGNA